MLSPRSIVLPPLSETLLFFNSSIISSKLFAFDSTHPVIGTQPRLLNLTNLSSTISVSFILECSDSADIKTQWDELKTLKNQSDFIDFLSFTRFNGSKDILDMLETKDLNTNSPYIIVQELCDYVFNNFKYITGITNVDSSLDDVWKLKAGVCQDFTNVLLQMVRMIGIPARYVSGYICANENITRGEGATHAWIEAYIPDYGWLGLDPTNNIIANENHVRLAVGRHYNDCAPVKGVFKGKVDEDLYVKVEVNTKKNLSESVIPPNTFIGSESNNSYQQNLERIQQQQQQQ